VRVAIKALAFMLLGSLLLTVQPALAASTDGTDCPSSGEITREKDSGSEAVTQKEFFRQSYDEAECLRKAAAAEGAEWLETESLLHRSLEEADKGHWETASRLVQKANFQAQRALRQAENEAEAWKHRVVD
jgi:hypothetical protein